LHGEPTSGSEGGGMLACVRHLVEGHKNVMAAGIAVPSRVWLKAPEKSVKLRRIFPVSVGELGSQVIGMTAPREMDILGNRSGDCDNGRLSRVVQSVFEIPQGVTGELAELIRHRGYADLEQFVRRLRVVLYDRRIWVCSEINLSDGIKLLGVFTSPGDQGASAGEINGA